ncbi:MAG: phosphoribosylformylglycinamidine synthase subunit PurQ [Candidatus Gracilibacteria bacterium]|nr:phosphoribosylformylglycinamidine synthase subunit PurQ [Candidatus Gracilibacteria bacterium]
MSSVVTLCELLQEQPALLKRFHKEFPSLTKVSTQRTARVQTRIELSAEQKQHIHELLLANNGDRITREQLKQGHLFEIAYQPAVQDPEHIAIEKILKTNGYDDLVEKVKMATIYVFEGITEHEAETLVREYLFNGLLHVIHKDDFDPESLSIDTKAEPTQIIEGFRDLNLRELKELSETRSLYMEDHYLLETQRKFKEEYDRDPTDAELEYLAQRTSDHCFHTTWKSLGLFKHLKGSVDKVLPNRPDIVSVFVDNSGVMAAGGDTTYMIKGETHNSPTAIAPVGGVETMHGGCLRDIIGTGQGGYPTMATQVFVVGSQTKEEMGEDYEVEKFLDPLVILRGMVDGVQNYGNPMGIPNFGGRVFLHPKFFGKPLALGICLGTGKKGLSNIGTPKTGDIALLIGASTGRDGIHGATMSSAANTEETVKKEGAAVQIGDPYTERLFMEATPELRHLMRAYGDLGAGGIASCFGEMAEGVGLDIDLEHIPVKYQGLSPWEKLESESQERMGMAVAPENLAEVKKILTHHEVPFFELGVFADHNKFVVKHGTETIVDLDYEWLEGFPIPKKEVSEFFPDTHNVFLTRDSPNKETFLNLLVQPELADQSIFTRRWDSTVQGKTLRESCAPFTNMPYDQGIVVPDPDSGETQVLSLCVNPWWAGNPANMARATFAGAVSKQIAAGVKRNNIAMCDNFYTPKSRDKVDFDLTQMVYAITDMMEFLDTPAISGKDSSSGTTKMTKKNDGMIENFEIAPTICMSAMGMGADAMKVVPKEFQKAGNKLFFIPAGIVNDASGSYLVSEKERMEQFNYQINLEEYRKTIDRLSEVIESGKIKAISVIDDGGIFHRLFEMMLGSEKGIDITFKHEYFTEKMTGALPGAFLVETESQDHLEGIECQEIGVVINEPLMNNIIEGESISLKKMKQVWQKPWYDILKLPHEVQDTPAPTNPLPFTPSTVNKKKVSVVYTTGTNNHNEMLRVWQKLGCDAQLVSVTDPHAKFADADIVAFPGGFADGDYLGAAKVWHQILENQFKDQMNFLRSGKIPVIGICNGFQVMTRAGFFGDNLRLVENESLTYQQRWVTTKFTDECSQSIWTKGLEGKELAMPLSHGFGRFVIDGEMKDATISMVYSPDTYPNNPNGSDHAIAGVFAGDQGQFWGGMPHPERALENFQFNQSGMIFFENLLKNLD